MYKRVQKGVFYPKFPEKYVGNNTPIYRSSWEWTFMKMCDENDNILHWASEPMKIPYMNPIKNKYTVYVPDFLIEYVDANKKKNTEIIEIKPKKETFMEAAKSKKDQLNVYVNMAKWKAASNYAANHGLRFRVINEEHIFGKK